MILLLIQTIDDESDKNKLSEIYIKHQALFFYKSLNLVRNNDTADDIIQEAMIKVIKKISDLRELSEAQFVAYIVKTIQHCAVDYQRRNSSVSVLSEIERDENSDILNDDDFMESLDRKDLSVKLGIALKQLSHKERNVLIYKYFFEYTDSQIAEFFNIKPGSVRMTLSRARKNLRKTLSEAGVN